MSLCHYPGRGHAAVWRIIPPRLAQAKVKSTIARALCSTPHLIFKPLAHGGRHVQAGRQHREADGEYRQLPLLGLAGEALDAHNVAPLAAVVQLREGLQIAVRIPVWRQRQCVSKQGA